METTYQTTVFVKGMAYTAGLRNFMQDYLTKFPDVETIHLLFEEIPYYKLNQYRPKKAKYSADAKTLYLHNGQCFFHDRNGKPGNAPSPYAVFQNLIFLFDQAAQAHSLVSNKTNL